MVSIAVGLRVIELELHHYEFFCPSTIVKIAILSPTLAAATTLAFLFAGSGFAAIPSSSPTPAAADDKLQSEFLFDLVLEAQMPTNLATANGGL